MKTFGNKTYLSRSETKQWSSEIPIGDPFGGVAYGERNDPVTAAISGGLGLVGGILGGNSAKDAANTQANATRDAANIGAQQASFRPVGVTTNFGNSNFVMGPDGRLQSAGYNLNPSMQGQFNQLQGIAGRGLNQFQQGQQAAQPLYQGAQGMMSLGNQYLGTSPQEQAAKYMADQQALLAPGREQQLAGVRQGLFNTGRSGLATGATNAGNLQATNPEMAAYYNSIAQQDLGLAANATQGGMDYANFGGGMLNNGSAQLGNYYNSQSAAMNPYNAAMGGMQNIESLGQQALSMGAGLGAGNQTSANAIYQGGTNAAQAQYGANAYNPMATALQGASGMLGNYAMATGQNPFSGMFAPQMGSIDGVTGGQGSYAAGWT